MHILLIVPYYVPGALLLPPSSASVKLRSQNPFRENPFRLYSDLQIHLEFS